MIRIERYDYLYGYTAAQIELIFCDAPVIKYKRSEDKAKPGENGYKPMSAYEAQSLVKNFKRRKIVPTKKEYDLKVYMETGEKKEKQP